MPDASNLRPCHRVTAPLLGSMLTALVLAGCSGPRTDLQSGAMAERVSAEKSFVDMPPGGPAIVGVVQHNYATSTAQEVILGNNSHTSGQNVLEISMFGPVKSVTGTDNAEPNDALSQSRVHNQMIAALPGVPMKVSPYYAQNRYGPFGYASGLSKQGDMCLYAWQRIRAPEISSTLTSGQGTIQIRLRLCQQNATEGDLLAVMTGFTITTYFRNGSWNPYGDPPPAPEDLGRIGKPILPSQEVTAAPPVVVVAAPVVRRRRIVPVAQAAAPVAAPVEAPNVYQDYGMVPPPSP
jgi:hypothetical protein